jgi:hypothetical protein
MATVCHKCLKSQISGWRKQEKRDMWREKIRMITKDGEITDFV